MEDYRREAYSYFWAPNSYFWKWGDDGQVIEWKSTGTTICYREDLISILKAMAQDGLPRLGALLLVLGACKEGNTWHELSYANMAIDRSLTNASESDIENPNVELIQGMNQKVREFQLMCSRIPNQYKTGEARILLIQTIFKNSKHKTDPVKAQGIIAAFESGELDDMLFRYETFDHQQRLLLNKQGIYDRPNMLNRQYIRYDLTDINEAQKKYPTEEALVTLLRTGLPSLPAALPLELPEQELEGLMGQLAADRKTAGIAKLSQRLIAALNIPLHLHGSSDQPLGGISDIANRGNFDRLLLSELANDDTTLMARLANNEALYLRREELPHTKNKKRIVLVDTSLPMWGTPRVFAIAAALACAEGNKLKFDTSVFALGGQTYSAMDMGSKEGVMQSLELLNPNISSTGALIDFMNTQNPKDEAEYIYIAAEELTHTTEYLAAQVDMKLPLNYVITVNRDGHLQMYQHLEKRRKQVCDARFDLEELLNAKPIRQKAKTITGKEPAAFAQKEFPLYYPTSKTLVKHDIAVDVKDVGVFIISQDNRLLQWPDRYHGALELLNNIEPGDRYLFCRGELKEAHTLLINFVGKDKKIVLYHINHDDIPVYYSEYSYAGDLPTNIRYEEPYFYWQTTSDTIFQLHMYAGEITKSTRKEIYQIPYYANVTDGRIRKFINNGYTTINRINHIFLDQFGRISIDGRPIELQSNNHLYISPVKTDISSSTMRAVGEHVGFPDILNNDIRFLQFTWPDGSIIITDSRGMLHFISADPAVPEFTVVAILDKTIAAWSADGKCCGSAYFIKAKLAEVISEQKFYKNYIQQYINALQ